MHNISIYDMYGNISGKNVPLWRPLFMSHITLNNLVVLFRLFPGVFVHNISIDDTYGNIAEKDVP